MTFFFSSPTEKNIGYCNAERYKCPPNEQYKY
jgi:hypothetical protein